MGTLVCLIPISLKVGEYLTQKRVLLLFLNTSEGCKPFVSYLILSRIQKIMHCPYLYVHLIFLTQFHQSPTGQVGPKQLHVELLEHKMCSELFLYWHRYFPIFHFPKNIFLRSHENICHSKMQLIKKIFTSGHYLLKFGGRKVLHDQFTHI